MEAVGAVEAIETVEVLKPGKSPVRTLKSSRLLNSALFRCFQNNYFWIVIKMNFLHLLCLRLLRPLHFTFFKTG